MVYFFDRNLPRQLARMLDHFDTNHQIVHLDDRFPDTTSDPDWLSQLARWTPRPVVVSGDGRILRNPAESQVLKGAKLTFVFMAKGWTNLHWHEQAWKAVKVWPQIVEQTDRPNLQPTVFEVPVSATKVVRFKSIADL